MATDAAPPFAASASRARGPSAVLRGALAVTAVALVVRLIAATTQSFWLDEAYTEHLIHLGLGSMLSQIPRTESTPPLYYLIAWAWTHGFGYGELALRSISALAGAGTATLAYLLAVRLAGLRAGLIAGALVTLSPLMVWYSQEARAYALATLLATASLLCLLVYAESDGMRALAGWAVTAGLGLCTHYFVAFVVAPELIWLIAARRDRRAAMAAVAVVILAGLALAPLALAQRGTGHADYIAQGGLGHRLVALPKQFLIGYANPAQVVTTVLAGLLVLGGAVIPLARDRGWATLPGRLVLAAGLSCTLVPMVLAVLGADFLDTRNLLPALVPLTVIAAVGFTRPTAGRLGPALAGGLAVLYAAVVLVVNTDVVYQRPDWRGVSQTLGRAATTRVIVISPGNALLPVQIYLPRVTPLGSPLAVRELDIANVAGGAYGTKLAPVAPEPHPRVPAGFVPAGTFRSRAYVVQRFRASRPVTVTAPELTGLRPRSSAAILLQR